ncbi:sigma-70 family RNA polymerase sigma factor [Nocardioides sp. W7]|uniref:RNA polymerase sigma factor n=1 Tax=Nocardioides sp. W7 TaxID=2931390 RepID=UPI001FD539C5|nr:sigma-70 family RNA polymerase sigma factor [Nocardioides sp. W7]
MDSSYFSDFYAEMRPGIARFIRARFPFDLAEDLANETMLTLWQKDVAAPTSEIAERQLRSFVYSIAIGHIRNAERKQAAEGRLTTALGEAKLLIRGDIGDPTYEAVLPDRVGSLIAELSFDDRQALNLMLAGFRTSDIAAILEVTPKAASMRLSRAKDRLRTKMAGEGVRGDG